MNKKTNSININISDRVMYVTFNAFLFIFLLTIAYPIIFIISSSFSSPYAVSMGRVTLWPVDFSIAGYKAVFSHKNILLGYSNTIIYTVVGTLISVVITMITAYAMSRKDWPFRNGVMFFFVFTMYFSGGLIPTYILMTQLKFVNTIWVMVIPGALSVHNMILARTFIISSIPNELLEASQMDGCSDIYYLFAVVIPLSKAVIAVITLFCIVGHWNSYFSALIYLNDRKKYPLQLILRAILVQSKIVVSETQDPDLILRNLGMEDLLKYSLIIVSSAPIIAIYPFIQKYFVKGIMLGSLKG
jgi:putative aldouronate transport system permease protein